MADEAQAGRNKEPNYNGRPLSEWLRYLQDKHKHVRKFALDGLQDIGPEGAAAIPTLAALVHGTRADLRTPSAILLGRIGKAAMPTLQEALGHADKNIRVAAAAGLGAMGRSAAAAIPTLRTLLQDPETSYPARTALCRIEPGNPEYETPEADDSDDGTEEPAHPTTVVQWSWLGAVLVLTALWFFRRPSGLDLVLAYWTLYLYEAVFNWVQTAAVRWCGFRVERVAVGSGPVMLQFHWRGMDCSFHVFPGMGDVTWYQPRTEDDPYERVRLWYNAAFDGVATLALILVGILILAGSWWWGRAEPAFMTGPARVGWVRPGSPLAQAGLQAGDEIRGAAYPGQMVPVQTWNGLLETLATQGNPDALDVQRDGRTLTFPTAGQPILLDLNWEMPPVVAAVRKDSLAARRGIMPADTIVAVDGKPMRHGLDVKQALFAPDRPPSDRTLTIRRKDQTVEVRLPASDLSTGSLGVVWKAEHGPTVSVGFTTGLQQALLEVWQAIIRTARWATWQGEFAHVHDKAAEETDARWLHFIPPEGFSARTPIFFGIMGLVLAGYHLVSLLGTVVLAAIESVQKRSMPDAIVTTVDWVLSGTVVGLFLLRLFW